LLNSDPARASQMLRMGIDTGLVGEELFDALDTFRDKDPSLGDELFKYALLKSKNNSQYPALKIIVLAYYLFPNFGEPGGPQAPRGAAPPNPALVAQYLNSAYAVLMLTDNPAQPAASDSSQKTDIRSQMDYWAIQSLLPYFDRYMPDKGLALRGQLNRAGSKIPGETLDLMESFNRPGIVQDLVSRALKATGPEKDELYTQAAVLALQKGDFEQSLSIVKSIGDEQRKTALETAVRVQGVTDAITKEDYETAYRYAKDVPRLQQRIFAFSQLSSALFDKKDRQRALEVLSEAEALTSKAENGPDKARAMLTLAGAVARIDIIRGFETMKSAIDAINRTSLTLTPAGILTIGGRGAGPLNTFNFNDAFTPLARGDFQGALLLAQSLERREASVLAQLAICRAALIKAPGDNKSQEEKTFQQPPGKDAEPAGKDKEKDKEPAAKSKKKSAKPETKP
jgi:tetratricopeptide (TPR) repeat protein